ncbi:hypothetical protein ACIOGZ_05120 [Kitasatospora sp. NPDC088160]|uniref:hypothetical protein n=1 Tax=Kitasatospora sp. NPDC088160 TaxID=3364072 RepID=UPI00381655A9
MRIPASSPWPARPANGFTRRVVPQTDIRGSTYWALPEPQLITLASDAGFTASRWQPPALTGFFQPVLIARTP